jgi:nicotinate-nucleotide adenylyltransferase
MERLGILGGTFDPPHWGHLWLAENGRQSLGLDRVLFLPVGRPPHKPGAPIADPEQRLAMLALATREEPAFVVSDLDVRRPEPHYMATLLPLVIARYPAADLWLLMGSDSLRDFASWYRPERILAQCRLAVLPRPDTAVDWTSLSARLPGIDGAVSFLPGPSLDVSGQAIRARLAAGAGVRYLLPPTVEEYLRADRIYERPQPDGHQAVGSSPASSSAGT